MAVLRGVSGFILLHLSLSLATPLTAAEPAYAPSSRLVDIRKYDVDLSIPELAQTPVGALVRIEFEALTLVDTLTLHAESGYLTIHSARTASGEDLPHHILPGEPSSHGLSGSLLEITLPEKLVRGETAIVEIRYGIAIQPEHDPRGLFFDPDHHGSAVLNTRNWPYFARFWLPANDHPSDAAQFRFTLRVPGNVAALANGRLVSSVMTGERGVHIWEQNEPIPTYAVQLIIGELTSTETVLCFEPDAGERTECSEESARVPVSFHAPPALPDRDSFTSQIRRAEDSLVFFAQAFGPYRFD